MAIQHWKALFQPHIWQRGVEYYQHGHILEIQRYNNRVDAEVEGSEVYNVSVTLNAANSIVDYSCDCPYGEDGTPCKHLAALLCALEEKGIPQTETQDKKMTEDELVALLSEQQMRELLIRLAKKDSYIKEILQLTATSRIPKNQKKQWEMDLEELTDSFSDRHDYIHYEDADDYCSSLVEYMDDRLPDMLDTENVMDAFELVWLVFQTGMEQDMDDSDGSLTMLAECCMSAWSDILNRADLDQQREIFRRFTESDSDNDLISMFLDDYLYDAPWRTEMGTEILPLLDRQIQTHLKSENNRYRLEQLILHRIHWMESMGEGREIREQYLKKYHFLPKVREIEISNAMQEKNWDAAWKLLVESKELDADKPGLVAGYSRKLIDICEKTGNRSALQQELNAYICSFWQENLSYVNKLKELMEPEKWIEKRNLLLDQRSMTGQVYALLEQEGLYEELMQRIEKRTDVIALDTYGKLLKKDYGRRCTDVYQTYLLREMERASNRKEYASVVRTLKKLKQYPNGNAQAQELADMWKEKYRRRTSMLDELKKAGF